MPATTRTGTGGLNAATCWSSDRPTDPYSRDDAAPLLTVTPVQSGRHQADHQHERRPRHLP